tara:strand:- start:366 stop:1118 length:753 start_codon:yes stop_codon:yes gene_type:complete
MKKTGWGKVLLILVLIFFSISCCSKNNKFKRQNQNVYEGSHPYNPAAAYYINQNYYINSTVPGVSPVFVGSGNGSGVGIRNSLKYTDILTAGHVCTMPDELIILGGSQTVELSDVSGESFLGTIYAIDEENDLCIIRIKEKRPVLKLATSNPNIGDNVYSAGYPQGLFMPGLLHFFHGYFSGVDPFRNGYYNFPASPGSSGSAIIDDNGEVIGIISAVLKDFHHSTIGPSVEPITIFLLLSEYCDSYCVQ